MLFKLFMLACISTCTMGTSDSSCPHGQCDSQGSSIQDEVMMLQVGNENKQRKPLAKASENVSMSQSSKTQGEDGKDRIARSVGFEGTESWLSNVLGTKMGLNNLKRLRAHLKGMAKVEGEEAVLKKLQLPANLSLTDFYKALDDSIDRALLEKSAAKSNHTSGSKHGRGLNRSSRSRRAMRDSKHGRSFNRSSRSRRALLEKSVVKSSHTSDSRHGRSFNRFSRSRLAKSNRTSNSKHGRSFNRFNRSRLAKGNRTSGSRHGRSFNRFSRSRLANGNRTSGSRHGHSSNRLSRSRPVKSNRTSGSKHGRSFNRSSRSRRALLEKNRTDRTDRRDRTD